MPCGCRSAPFFQGNKRLEVMSPVVPPFLRLALRPEMTKSKPHLSTFHGMEETIGAD